jgi:hypothetical protein
MRTVTGLFDTYDNARSAVAELESLGVASADISIVSNKAVHGGNETLAAEGAGTGAGIGAVAGGTGGLLAGLGIMAIPGVGPVVAAGWLVATAVGAVAGAVAGGAAGGIVGAMINAGVPEEDANVYAEGVRRGGTMVVAKVDEAQVPDAEDILQRANRVDIAARRTAYREGGWDRFDESAAPFNTEEIEAERRRWRSGL